MIIPYSQIKKDIENGLTKELWIIPSNLDNHTRKTIQNEFLKTKSIPADYKDIFTVSVNTERDDGIPVYKIDFIDN